MELLQPDWTDVLSELVANNPSHSQQEADCGGWAASLRQQQQGWSAALRRGKLEMWNNDFYWVLSKQTHIRLDQGPSAWLTIQPPSLWTPTWRSSAIPSAQVLMKSTTKPFSQHFTSCPVPGMQEGGHQVKGALVMGSTWRPTDVKGSRQGFHIATITCGHIGNALQITFQSRPAYPGRKITRCSSAKQCPHKI